ncbi:MAG TPA: amylo-alpha-1,6-glucosidase [Polyangiaceae bacterium]|nr:amylo-alpha-1,6-glucosidase [Polyangiaceae bacterium]
MKEQRSRQAEWRAGRDGPWPLIEINGSLERAEREWLHTNGAGAYAMSTLALMHTRRYHGLLVAALDPPVKRYSILSHLETTVEVGGRAHRLATHQFPGVAPTPGYRMLQRFAQDPLPRWEYKVGKFTLERCLCLVRGLNMVVLAYTWQGKQPARLLTKPLMPLRPIDGLMREHGAMVQRVALRPGAVELQPVPDLPTITFTHEGVFMGSPDWWRRFEYLEDLRRHPDFQEDMWTPGTFELLLEPGKTAYLTCAVGKTSDRHPSELLAEAAEFELAQDPGPEQLSIVRSLFVAAEQFCADACERPAVMAGYPWYEPRARDSVMAAPGLFLARGKIEECKRALATFLRVQHSGLLPVTLAESSLTNRRQSVDGSLWLFEAARELVERTGAQDPFIKTQLYPALRRTFVRFTAKGRNLAWLTADGLLAASAEALPLTWMDARAAGNLVSPRRGLPVEFQALWSRGSETLARIARELGDSVMAEAAEAACQKARAAFRAHFWCKETDYPFDCISEERDAPNSWTDASVRPNAVLALAVDPNLFERWQVVATLSRVQRELLTPRGLRSLSPKDPAYRGHHEGNLDEREGSYHQGTVWPYLMGFYARAALRLKPEDFELREELIHLLQSAAEEGLVLGHVAQLTDGEAPHRFRGCPAQAWSCAEVLRVLVSDLGL